MPIRAILLLLAGLFVAALSAPAAAAEDRAIAVVALDPAQPGPPDLRRRELYRTKIKRYKETLIYGIAEYDPFNCKFIEPGAWSDPKSSLTPKSAGELRIGELDGTIPSGSCAGLAVTYRVVYFKWTLRRNWTARTGEGPLATFSARWTTKDKRYDFPFEFEVTVPVVRPIGETTVLAAFTTDNRGPHGRWAMTLKPPRDDPDFIFDGEVIREKNTTDLNTCQSRAPIAVGPTSVTPVGKEATWTVGELIKIPAGRNQWGTDDVGWDNCPVFAYRCAHATQPACFTKVTQEIQIKSQADKDFSKTLYVNKLSEAIGGMIFEDRNKVGCCEVRSQRADAPEAVTIFVSSEKGCEYLIPYLKAVPGSCYAPPPK